MKQCPSCLTTYTDETLRYCLADGSVLNSFEEEQATMVRITGLNHPEERAVTGRDEPIRVEIPLTTADTTNLKAQRSPGVVSSGLSGSLILKVLAVIIGLAILLVLLAGVVGGVFYYSSGKPELPVNNANAKQLTQASPTPSKDDRDELRDQIANLEKRLDQQKKTGQSANVPMTLPGRPATSTTARVESPGDGFLALRSLPSSETGNRILKIPHGATVSIGACGPAVTPVKRKGRWCQASYNGYDGWIFDAYLIY